MKRANHQSHDQWGWQWYSIYTWLAACEEVFLVMEPEATEEQKDGLAVEAALFWNTVMKVLIELEDRGTNTDRVSRPAKDRPKAGKARLGPRGDSRSFGIALAPALSDEHTHTVTMNAGKCD